MKNPGWNGRSIKAKALLATVIICLSSLLVNTAAAAPRRSQFDPRGEMHIPIGIPDSLDTLKTFVEPEGCFSPGAGSYGIYYWVRDESTGKLYAPTFDGIKPEYGLAPGGYLLPWSSWRAGEVVVRTEICEVKQATRAGDSFLVGARARLHNQGSVRCTLSLFVALRPLGPAGFPVKRLEVSPTGDALLVEGHPAVIAKTKPSAAGVLKDDTIGETLLQGRMPSELLAAAEDGTCSGALRFDLSLAPGESKTCDFVCPVLPGRRAARHAWDNNTWFKIDQAVFNPTEGGIPVPDLGLNDYRRISVGALFKQSQADWLKLLGKPRIHVPDPRWTEFATAISSHLAVSLNEGEPDLAVINLSPFNRDAAVMADVLLKLGHFDLARIYINYFLAHPFSGRVQPEADNPGQILWTLGEYWQLTRDRRWLAGVYPKVRQFVALIRYYRTAPGPHWVCDDSLEFGEALPKEKRKELKPGACDGYNPIFTEAFDIAGLCSAALLAESLGEKADADAWSRLAAGFFANYDQTYGTNLAKGYGSYCVQWPCRLYPLDSGKAFERFKDVGAKKTGEWRYFPLATAHQGLLSGNRLSGCGTIASHLDEEQMRGWYAFDEGGPSGVGGWPKLLSTWSWNYPPEPRPQWAKVSARAMPDGWGLAELFLVMRDSLLFEDGNRLILFGGIDPKWFGQKMAVTALPTWFGPASFTYQPTKAGARLKLSGANPPGGFVLRLPPELGAAVSIHGKPTKPSANGDFPLPTDARTIEITLRNRKAVFITHTNYHNWPDSLLLRNGEVEVVVVPAIGRIMQFGFIAEEGVFWENRALAGKISDGSMKGWINFGGDKTWPAPEAEWSKYTGHGWCPPPAFDGLPSQAKVEGDDIILTTPVDRYYGISAQRRIHLDPVRPVLTVTTTYRRVAGEPSKVGVWVITQLADPAGVFLPLPPQTPSTNPVVSFAAKLPPDLKVENGLVCLTRDRKSAYKIGSEAGVLVWVGPRAALRIDAPRAAGAEYPDQGSSVEVYTNQDPLQYVELETLGPVQTMKAGDEITRANTYTLFHRTGATPLAEALKILGR